MHIIQPKKCQIHWIWASVVLRTYVNTTWDKCKVKIIYEIDEMHVLSVANIVIREDKQQATLNGRWCVVLINDTNLRKWMQKFWMVFWVKIYHNAITFCVDTHLIIQPGGNVRANWAFMHVALSKSLKFVTLLEKWLLCECFHRRHYRNVFVSSFFSRSALTPNCLVSSLYFKCIS